MEGARRLYEEALACRRVAGDPQGKADTLGAMGAIAHLAGALSVARRLYDESLDLYLSVGYPYGIAVTLNNLGELAEAEGDLPGAIALFARAEERFRDLGATLRAVPSGHLKRLEESLGPDRWSQLRAEAEARPWQERIGSA